MEGPVLNRGRSLLLLATVFAMGLMSRRNELTALLASGVSRPLFGFAVVAAVWGLLVPVIRHADRLNLVGLAKAANDLAERARSKRLSPEEVQGGTFTVTNPGVFGSLFGTPIINQPQVAILGMGGIKKRPVVIQDAIAIRSMMYWPNLRSQMPSRAPPLA